MVDALDELDRRLVAALHLAPRASFDDLAGVLGVGSSTIGRRFARLTDERLVRVVGQVEWSLHSTTLPVHLFVATSGARPSTVCDAMLGIPRVQHLVRTSGPHAIFATAHAADEAQTAALVERVHDLPGVASVLSLPVLAVPGNGRGAGWQPGLLTDDEHRQCMSLAAVHPAPSQRLPAPPLLESVEREIVQRLQQDGRASAAGLGRDVGLAPSTAHRLVHRVLDNRWVRPRVEIEPELLGFQTPFVLRADAPPGRVSDVVAQLAALPQTRFTTQVAGPTAVLCTGLVADRAALGAFVERELAGIDGLTTVEVDVVSEERRRYWMDRGARHGLTAFRPPDLR